MLRRVLVTAAALALTLVAIQALAMHHELPKGYRTWGHVKSMVITDKGHGLYGFHNTYANPAALEALRAGKPFPKGAEFVTSFYEVAGDGAMLSQGKKIMDAYMKKDEGAKQTGGWWFNAFGPDGKPLGVDVVKGCYECHAGGAKGTDLIFSKFVD
ncbi:MAG: cytochrome P460 family protein [Anaeromyxobacteraceae bacterium]|nr:cytochrome P460 family protein [Anaeromyxobacteraceae bacterium]